MSGTHSRGRATQEQLPRTYWQKIAGKFVPDIFNRLYPYRRPAFSALPPSVVVVCRGYVSLQRWPYKGNE